MAGCSCEVATVASSSSEESRGADSVTFDEGFQACLGADVGGCRWGLGAVLFFVFGAMEDTLKGCRVTVRMSRTLVWAELENGSRK